jgi:succinyl-CoA synthetase beta subunit
MEIEEVAAREPEKIIKEYFSPFEGLSALDAAQIASRLVQNPDQAKIYAQIFQDMAKMFLDLDASLIEINPLALMSSGKVIAIDAKINLDDNGLYRHPEVAALYDPRQEDPREVEAKKFDLSYVGLDGNIGCVVNGAGLAMATMDIIKYAGGEPANFLDVGGGASKEKVAAAFKIILTDPKVKAILINIFGGIMRCDVVAEGILAAVEELGSRKDLHIEKIPIVVRLEGTNVKEGRAILEKSSLNLVTANGFEEAAEKVVELAP